MIWKTSGVLLLCLLSSTLLLGATASEDGEGPVADQEASTSVILNEFYLGYYANDDGATDLRLVITTTETQSVSYTISIPGLNFIQSGNVTANEWKAIEIPIEAEIRSIDDQFKGIYLKTSSDKVNVFGENIRLDNVRHSIGTFNVLPVARLNTDQYTYYGLSLSRVNGQTSNIVVVGAAVSTVMELTVTQPVEVKIKDTVLSLTPGIQYSFTINWLQTVLLASPNDLSGTRIVTDKPVAVFSGHQCSNLDEAVGCDHIVEQIPPEVMWDTEFYFLLPSFQHSVKILSASNDTIVDLYCDNFKENFVINEGETFTKTFETQPQATKTCTIQSSKEVLVSQFGHDDLTAHLMVLVPGTVHYFNKFELFTVYDENYPRDEHRTNVIVLAQYFQPEMIYLMTDTKNETLENHNWLEIIVNNTIKAYATVFNIPYGVSTIIHANPSALLTVTVYSFSSITQDGVNLNTAYGHYGRLNQEKFLPCPPLNAPENGMISCCLGDDGVLTEGDTYSFSCYHGFELSGDDTRTCQSNGSWSGSQPVCVEVPMCQQLENPSNGTIACSLGPDGVPTEGDTCLYICDDGFEATGGDIVRECGSDGSWTGSAPTCETLAVTCGLLDNPNNGRVDCSLGEDGVVTEGSTCIYVCDDGFVVTGDDVVRECQSNGSWSGSAPTCERVICFALEAPDNGMIECTGFEFEDTCTVTCDPGYVLSGSATRTCQSDASWNGTQAMCAQACSIRSVRTGAVVIGGNATITFSAVPPHPEVSFRCKLDDNRKFEPCTSPLTYHDLSVKRHRVIVQASCLTRSSRRSKRIRFKIRN